MVASSISLGVNGLYSAQAKALDASQRIASHATDGSVGDLTKALVDLNAAELEAMSAAKVVDSAYKITGLLLNIEV